MSSLSADDMHRIFKKLDLNNDDLVSTDEIKRLLESMKLVTSLNELECFAGKKNLNFTEFVYLCNTMSRQEAGNTENDMFKSFEIFDKNHDGFISCNELHNALSVLGLIDEHDVIDVKMMIKAYDLNSDGLVDFDEFKKMMS